MKSELTWVEVSRAALKKNIQIFRKSVGKNVIIAPSVKANAYGHGLIETTKTILQAGADWVCVNALFEAGALRNAGVRAPIYIKGYVPHKDLPEAVDRDTDLVVYNKESIQALGRYTNKAKKNARVHIKIETGNNRQGVLLDTLKDFVQTIQKYPYIEITGAATHFADIEDSPDQKYANYQLENFQKGIEILKACGVEPPYLHCANSAATLLYPNTHFTMVRPGIATYGLWPSELIARRVQKKFGIQLTPALSWKTRIAQIKDIPAGSYVGYGCTYKTKRRTRLAILPVGYYDGYDRGLSNKSWAIIRDKKAPVRGRVCMNITMVDVSNIPEARLEDEVILLGRDGKAGMSIDEMAALADTINYEIPTRIRESIPRVIV
ncbi:alanine racemase [Candidatus Peregrinibacteria bacterium CG11_big_fil_rev_8_21_14_0_20_46_8]|nr:MAG: alanine racemase [Candidatus Peregrinibacteria bacterium CG11_big_fil_rev_8_21_14_0_20_46_8]